MTATTTQGIASLQISSPFAQYLQNINQTQVLEIVMFLVFAVWALFSLTVLYHWVRYGHRSWLTTPALAAHIAVSAALFIFAASGFHYI